jgi:hypothetical protein
MSLEAAIDRLAGAMERLASVAENNQAVRTTPNPPVDNAHVEPGAEQFSEPKKPKKDKPAKPAKTAPPAAAEEENEAPVLDLGKDVRPVLNELQEKTSAESVITLLQKFGGPPLSKIPAAKYADLVKEAKAKLALADE